MFRWQKELNSIGGVIFIRGDQVYTNVIECRQPKTAVPYV